MDERRPEVIAAGLMATHGGVVHLLGPDALATAADRTNSELHRLAGSS